MKNLPDGWVVTTLGEVIQPRQSRVIPVATDDRPYVSMEDVEPDSTKLVGRGRAGDMKSACMEFAPGDVLYGRLRPYLNKVCRPMFRGLASAEFITFSDFDRIQSGFLMYLLNQRAFVEFASRINEGDRPRVKWGQIRSFEIGLPPLDEQQRIVEAIEEQFSRLDAGVESLRKARRDLHRYRASMLRAAFDGLPTAPLGRYLAEPLRNGKSAKKVVGGRIRVLTLSAVTEGDFSERNTKFVNLDPNQIADLWAQPGDIFIERSNTPELVGTAAMFNGDPGFAIFPDLLIRVRLDERIIPRFAELALQSPPLRRYFQSNAKGISGSMPKIDQRAIEEAPMPAVDFTEQRRIVADVDRASTIIEAVAATVDVGIMRSSTLRQSILDRAFAGLLTPTTDLSWVDATLIGGGGLNALD